MEAREFVGVRNGNVGSKGASILQGEHEQCCESTIG